MTYSTKTPWLLVAAFLFSSFAIAQKPGPKPKAKPKSIVFAVLDGGKRVEPIVAVEGGKFVELSASDDAPLTAFATQYYKPRTAYPVIFGGAADGRLTIVKSNIGTECGGTSATTIARPVKAKLSGLVMALATNIKLDPAAVGVRRKPTVEERTEVEKLVRAEFTKNGASAIAQKNLRYHNLTALDVDGDDSAEFVGTYWIAPTASERRLLFFIAERDDQGRLAFAVSEHSVVTPRDIMTGDVKELDTGIGHELLLDVLDYDNDSVKEIFTIGQAFEGNNYYVYKRMDGKWSKVHDAYSYRCAF